MLCGVCVVVYASCVCVYVYVCVCIGMCGWMCVFAYLYGANAYECVYMFVCV